MEQPLNPVDKHEETWSKEAVERLRESLVLKVEYVATIKSRINSLEIASLSSEEFSAWVEVEKESLSSLFPDMVQEAQELDVLEKERDVAMYASWAESLKSLFPDTTQEIETPKKEKTLSVHSTQRIAELENNDGVTFVRTIQHFLDNLSLKKKSVEDIQKNFIEHDGLYDVPGKEGIYFASVGKNIPITFGPYEVIVHISPKERDEFFPDLVTAGGWHSPSTPFCFIVDSPDKDYVSEVESHEVSHNRFQDSFQYSQNPGSYDGFIVYDEQLGGQFTKRVDEIRQVIESGVDESKVRTIVDATKELIRMYSNHLHGEILADIENLGVHGKGLDAFDGYYGYAAEKIFTIIEEKLHPMTSDIGFELMREVMSAQKSVKKYYRETNILAAIARDHGKLEELKATVLMSPGNTKLSKRYLEQKLGETFTREFKERLVHSTHS